jgi:hypothetical protein
MKYETLKIQVAKRVYTQIMSEWFSMGDNEDIDFGNDANLAILFDAIAEKRPVRASRQDLANKCYEVVMDWDVRMVGRLREIFPKYFPASLKKGKLVAYMADNEDCDWMVEVEN